MASNNWYIFLFRSFVLVTKHEKRKFSHKRGFLGEMRCSVVVRGSPRSGSPALLSSTPSPGRGFRYYHNYNHVTTTTITWSQLQSCDHNYNHMTRTTITWLKLQLCDHNYNHMTTTTITWLKLQSCDHIYNHVSKTTTTRHLRKQHEL